MPSDAVNVGLALTAAVGLGTIYVLDNDVRANSHRTALAIAKGYNFQEGGDILRAVRLCGKAARNSFGTERPLVTRMRFRCVFPGKAPASFLMASASASTRTRKTSGASAWIE